MGDFIVKNGILIKHTENDADVVIPGGVTEIGFSAFIGCGSLTCVTIPDSVTRIGEYAFSDCIKLTDMTVPYGIRKTRAFTTMQ